jgi:ABC-2 type transport system permease protein
MTRAATHGAVMTARNLAHVIRDPGETIIGFGLPVMFVLVFGYVFGSGMAVAGDGNYREYLLPGVFVMTMLYGIGATATGMAYDLNRGVVDRFRSMPVACSALVAGRSAADLIRALLEVAVLVVCGVLVGWGWHRGLGTALLAIALIVLLRFALTWVGVFLGLSVPNPDVVALIVFPLAFPLTAVSNVFVPPEAMPGWLGTIAEWNPLSATVSAARELFGNPAVVGDSWIAQNAVTMAVVWPVVLTLIFAPLAVRRYTQLSR